jgi:hypothetical protein
MSLNAKFSLTPLESSKYLWNSANSLYEYYAYMIYYGAYIAHAGTLSLTGSYNNNHVYLACNNVGYPFPDPFPYDYYERAVARLRFQTDALVDEQYLMLFHLTCYNKIGIYLNGNLIREEDCNGLETIAVTFDCPGPNIYDTLYVVPQYDVYIKGVDCYVL